ncbi:hypothetical protein [Echinicola sediminis]
MNSLNLKNLSRPLYGMLRGLDFWFFSSMEMRSIHEDLQEQNNT